MVTTLLIIISYNCTSVKLLFSVPPSVYHWQISQFIKNILSTGNFIHNDSKFIIEISGYTHTRMHNTSIISNTRYEVM